MIHPFMCRSLYFNQKKYKKFVPYRWKPNTHNYGKGTIKKQRGKDFFKILWGKKTEKENKKIGTNNNNSK